MVMCTRFEHMLEDASGISNGGVFTYEIVGGRRITIINDPSLFEVTDIVGTSLSFALNSFIQVVFNPGEFSEREDVGDAVKVEMDKLVCTLANANRTKASPCA